MSSWGSASKMISGFVEHALLDDIFENLVLYQNFEIPYIGFLTSYTFYQTIIPLLSFDFSLSHHAFGQSKT